MKQMVRALSVVYLDTDNTQQSVEAIKLQARGLLKEVQPDHDKEAGDHRALSGP